jgi:hypothetical protein
MPKPRDVLGPIFARLKRATPIGLVLKPDPNVHVNIGGAACGPD